MSHPYMPIGEADLKKHKENVIKHVIHLLNEYKEDEEISRAIESLNSSIAQ